MKRVSQWLTVLVSGIVVLCMFNAQAATLSASVDRTTLEDGDVVQLTLEVAGGGGSGRPDSEPLERDFEVLGTSNRTQMNIINGSATSSTQWIFNLRPKRVGTLTIPALELDGERSQPITISVGKSSQTQGSSPDMFLETEVSPQSPYVQAQLRYTVRLYFANALQSGQLNEPSNADVLIHRIGEDRQFSVTREGRRYNMIERHYAMFAQQSGKLTIEAPVLNGQIVERRRGARAFNRMIGTTRPVRVRGEAREITIQARPAQAQGPGWGQDWIPAQSVALSGQWEPAQSSMKVGEPVTLILNLAVVGLTGKQLPEIVPQQLAGFSVYPDQAKVETTFSAQGNALGTRVHKIAFIPRQAGELTIPDIELRWWNTQTDREEIARLPGITRSVVADPAMPVATAALPPIAQQVTTDQPAAEAQPVFAITIWMWLSALLAVAWLSTIVMWVRARRRANHARVIRTDSADAHSISHNKAREQIVHGCSHNDASATRRALLAWGAVHWPDEPPHGLEHIAARIDDEPLRQALAALDGALYSQSVPWHGDELKPLLDRLPKT
ncbi:MAG: hypothetical protein ACI8W7_000211, partial [Gammaproteobacteria bacterium]